MNAAKSWLVVKEDYIDEVFSWFAGTSLPLLQRVVLIQGLRWAPVNSILPFSRRKYPSGSMI